jgi:hypothetical protein
VGKGIQIVTPFGERRAWDEPDDSSVTAVFNSIKNKKNGLRKSISFCNSTLELYQT